MTAFKDIPVSFCIYKIKKKKKMIQTRKLLNVDL